jgi:hypothetical protein
MRHLPSFSALIVVVGSAIGTGCAEPNSLGGSITDSHDLSFDAVQLRLFTDQQAFELRYTKALDSGDQDIVAKVVFDVPEGGVVLDDQLDVLAEDGRVERITAKNDPFPSVEDADFTFTAGGVEDGALTMGSWGATFDNGKTIDGTFEATLEHASFE